MKTVGAFCFGEEPSGSPSGDPEKILSSDGSEDAETSPPCVTEFRQPLQVQSHLEVPRILVQLGHIQRT